MPLKPIVSANLRSCIGQLKRAGPRDYNCVVCAAHTYNFVGSWSQCPGLTSCPRHFYSLPHCYSGPTPPQLGTPDSEAVPSRPRTEASGDFSWQHQGDYPARPLRHPRNPPPVVLSGAKLSTMQQGPIRLSDKYVGRTHKYYGFVGCRVFDSRKRLRGF